MKKDLNEKTDIVSKSNIASAIIKVTQEVKGVEKGMTIGSGNSSYKGVSDYDVKKAIRESMAKNGLVILPISITPVEHIERWEEVDPYSKSTQKDMKVKQSIFTTVYAKYLLLHESGDSIEICGYGHGIDSQDKSAGKATTYALKYALLYLFLIPTGAIDDADTEHSDTISVPQNIVAKPNLEVNTTAFEGAKKWVKEGNGLDAIKKKYNVSPEVEKLLLL